MQQEADQQPNYPWITQCLLRMPELSLVVDLPYPRTLYLDDKVRAGLMRQVLNTALLLLLLLSLWKYYLLHRVCSTQRTLSYKVCSANNHDWRANGKKNHLRFA